MESWLERNLALLRKRQPELAELLASTPAGPIEVLLSTKGAPTAKYTRSKGDPILLHSRYDPQQEARQNIKKIDLRGADYFILLGFGLGYTLDALSETTPRSECRYFVVESDLGILRAAFEARDLQGILSLPHLHLAWPTTGPEIGRQWMAFFDPVHARGNTFISLVPSIAINPDFFKSAAQAIQSQTFQIFTDINTLVTKSKVFLDNLIVNLPLARSSPGVSEFAGRMAGIPGLIVSAGPSLDRNIHELRGTEDHGLILSTDTALKPLLAAGVKPHFVLSGDPTEANYLHVKGADSDCTLFVVEATGFPDVFREFRGRTITCLFENSALAPLSKLLGPKGVLKAWGSVATMALDFALHLGCDPVIFVGQDLAHTDGRTYCTGLYWEEQLFADVSTPEQWKQRWESLRAGKPVVTMMDIFGRPIETTDKLAAYWNWMNKEIQAHPETNFVNATEGGILRDGLKVMSLREAKYRYLTENRGLIQRTEGVFARAPKSEAEPEQSILGVLKYEAMALRETLSEGLKLCESAVSRSPEQLLRELESLKHKIYSHRQISPLLDTFNQMGNVAFLRKQTAFKAEVGKSCNSDPIKFAYREYFDSAMKALEIVESALSRI